MAHEKKEAIWKLWQTYLFYCYDDLLNYSSFQKWLPAIYRSTFFRNTFISVKWVNLTAYSKTRTPVKLSDTFYERCCFNINHTNNLSPQNLKRLSGCSSVGSLSALCLDSVNDTFLHIRINESQVDFRFYLDWPYAFPAIVYS